MRKALMVVVGMALVVAAVLGMSARAEAVQATELWMLSAEAAASDDSVADESFVGTMATGRICSAMAEAMSAHMREDTTKRVVAFECRIRVIHLEPN
jgi:hypothetical protein